MGPHFKIVKIILSQLAFKNGHFPFSQVWIINREKLFSLLPR